jgi:hypothetical protein
VVFSVVTWVVIVVVCVVTVSLEELAVCPQGRSEDRNSWSFQNSVKLPMHLHDVIAQKSIVSSNFCMS